jgi:hypothetical protein
MREAKESSGENLTRGGVGFIGGILFFGAAWMAKLAVLHALEGRKPTQKEI